MRFSGRMMIGSALALGLAACGSPSEDKSAAGSPAADVAAPAADVAAPAAAPAVADAGGKPAAFAQCAACHAVEPGKHGIGPSLAGVYGTKAGELAGYTFSDKLLASGLTWDDATLDQWLAGPMKMVPGTKMTYAGMADAAKRKELIEYMKTLK
ncbi:cytochrome c family protein [Novosphingobium sp.]|uniref:c-type cytochrome n=1 Tax=Novosphingobium sp. TaxID=1874826 RepID=UPI0027328E96|nr:c-type cytochrome [Novosphingobium sp.]MDP3908280.1 c-type cytochrome [Novosphingobium sp.]